MTRLLTARKPDDTMSPVRSDAVLAATRALLWISSPADVAVIASGLVGELGGALVPAGEATRDALPVDVSFGVGDPVLPAAPLESAARARLERLRVEWAKARPYPITFSAGIAPALPNPRRALEAANRAMYRAKVAGRDRWQTATADDYS